MRCAILLLVALSSTAGADGGYLAESFGGGSYQGDLRDFSTGEFRLGISAGYVRGPWALEVGGAAYIPDFFYIDCYGDECLAAAAPEAGLAVAHVDVRRAWRVQRSPWTDKIGIDMVLHGGPRWFVGQDALDARRGPGVGGGATLDLNLRILSVFLDTGMDLGVMAGGDDGEVITVRLPYVAFGMRLGWM